MNSARDRACNLECVRLGTAGPKVVHEFVGPVKITLVDLTDVGYLPRIWGSALIALANLYIAPTVMTIIYFTLVFKLPITINAHIALCTVGFQLLMPSGMLMLNPLFGGASQLKKASRKYQHIFLQQCAFFCGVGGALHVLSSADTFKINPHTLTGLLAVLSAIAAEAMGPIAFLGLACLGIKVIPIYWIKYIHAVFGMTAYIASSVSMCFAIISPSFRQWCNEGLLRELPFILCVICLFYTILIGMSVHCRISERNDN